MSASALKIGERLRAALMQSSALGAILFAAPAHAQLSYNAPDPTVVSGSVTFDRGVAIPGTETYTVASPTAVIDFVPAAGVGNINFQNAGTTAVYQNAVNNPNFTILNRIVPADPTRQVIFNGMVISQIQSGTGQGQGGPGPTVRGGTVWFYSPGGIIVGASSVFVVGNLLLTTGDPTSGTGIISATDTFTLASTPNAGGTVSVQPGSIINATADNSYIAMVAPAVNQAGLIRVNGSAAFVAAETATLTINQGLFDISVDVGSSAAAGVPLQLRGSVTGPASLGSTDNQGIYAVAVPKNTAITMLIAPTGDLGFDVATVPTIENGGIYLQAGGDLGIFATSPAASRIRDIPQSTIAADILFRPGNVTSLVAAQASRDIEIGTLGTRVVSLEQNAFFFGQRNALLQADAGGTINAASGVTVNAFGNGVPGSATIRALGGSTISIAGEAAVYADRLSGRSYPSNFNVSRGGSSLVQSAGSFSAGSVVVSAVGGNAISSASAGGTATMEAVNGGAINISGTAEVTTSAYGFGLGGTGTGGTSSVRIDGGSITTGESLSISALGDARYTPGQASGIGGTAQLVSSPAGGLITTLGGTNIDARGIGSGAGSGDVTTGFGTGGTASVNFAATNTNATTTANLGTLLIEAGGFGGEALALSTAAGGAGTGGQAVLNAGVGTSVTAAETVLYADGVGGGSAVGTNSGAAVGGTARVTAGGVMNLASLKVFTSASGGTSAGLAGNGGSARAGNSVVEAIGIGALTVDESIAISSAANAGAGGGTGLGGLATAADARLTATTGGRIIATSVAVSADAVGGNGSTGGNGTASKGSISQGSGGSVSVAGAVTISGFGQGGTATVGAGGVGRGGDLRFVSDDGTISAGSVTLNAAGTGGASDGGTVGGAGIGGIANIGARIGLTSIGGNGVDTTLIANGIGGSAIAGTASGGAGTGGQALVGTVDAGRINLSNTGYAAFLQARGIGGDSLGNGTVGGLGTGGTASIFANLGSITINGLTVISSTGKGGDKYSGTIGSAGNGIGGTSSATAGNGGRLFVNTSNMLSVSAPGLGGLISGTGTEGNGGSGIGGSANVQAFGTTGAIVDFTGPLLFDVTANGQNGVGSAGIGGGATGGTASLVVSDGRSVTVRGTVQVRTSATAGSGVTSSATTAFAKGGTATIHAILGTLSITGGTDLTGNASINTASLGHDGGDATGGTVQLLSNAGGSVTVGGALSITSQATGGTNRGGGDGIGGTGTGGLATINSVGSVDVTGATTISATGTGGGKTEGTTGGGGTGIGGTARAFGNRGSVLLRNTLDADASGIGGTITTTASGFGGNGRGGHARLDAAVNGSATVNGAVTVSSNGTGGNGVGARGGDGVGAVPVDLTNGPFDQGSYIVADGGNVTLGSTVAVSSTGTGGTGTSGGNGVGGLGNVVAFGAAISAPETSTFTVNIDGRGGDAVSTPTLGGGAGGTGSIGGNGAIILSAAASGGTPAAGTPSSVTLGAVSLTANTFGGRGGNGLSGGDGGRGGDANIDGFAGMNAIAQASSGTLRTASLTQSLAATGGAGGDGGAGGPTAAGGAGGRGGDARGGFTSSGTASGLAATPGNSGSATLGNVQFLMSGVGGNGGNGGTGVTQGIGGRGGDATGGGGGLIARGTPVVAGDVLVSGIATGGNGGTGSVAGVGGNAIGGQIGLLVTKRFQRPERGSFSAANVVFSAGGRGGEGSVNGTSTAGATDLVVTNATASVGNISFSSTGAPRIDGFFSEINVADATLTVANAMSFQTGDKIGLFVDNGGAINVGTDFLLNGASIIHSEAGVAPANSGTITANTISLTGRNGIVTGANLIGTNNLALNAFGGPAANISIGNLRSTNGNVSVSTGTGSIRTGTITAGNSVRLGTGAPGVRNVSGIVTGNIVAGTQAATAPDLTEFGRVDIEADGPITTGNVNALNIDMGFNFDGNAPYGNIATGSLAAQNIVVDGGANLTVGSVTTTNLGVPIAPGENGYRIGLRARGDLTAGNISGVGSVGLAANGNIATGSVSAVDTVFALGGGSISVGGVTGGTDPVDSIFISNISITQTDPFFANFASGLDYARLNVDAIGNLTPVRTVGAITLTGAASAGKFVAASGSTFTSQAITAPNRFFIDALGAISTGALTATTAMRLQAAGAISTGNVNAASASFQSTGSSIATGAISTPNGITLTAAPVPAGSITTGALSSGNGIAIEGGGNVTVASARTVTGNGQPGANNIGIIATGTLQAGALTAVNNVGLLSRTGSVTAGSIAAGNSAILLAATSLATGGIQTSQAAGNLTFIGNASQFTGTNGFNPAGFLTATPALTGSNVTIGGAVSTALFRAGAGGDFTASDTMTAASRIGIVATGTATFSSLAAAPAIDIRSANVQIGATGGLGNAQTQTLNLTAVGAATLGGPASTAPGYQLDSVEISRLQAGSIGFAEVGFSPTLPYQLTLRDFTINGSNAPSGTANITSATGSFSISSDGSIQVLGNIRLNNAADGNTLSFNAVDSFDLVTDAGSVGVFGSATALGGVLSIRATDISVADAALFALSGATDFDTVSPQQVVNAINTPSRIVKPEGSLQANRIDLAAEDFLVIQNSGTGALAAGFTAGSGGMSITATGTNIADPADPSRGLDLVVNGRILGTAGAFITNAATRNNIIYRSINAQQAPLTSFATLSTVNGCPIGNGPCVAGEAQAIKIGQIVTDVREISGSSHPITGSPSIGGSPVESVAQSAAAATAGSTIAEAIKLPTINLVTVIDAKALVTDPVVEETVTGGGNPSLWEGSDADDAPKPKPSPSEGEQK